MLSSQLPHPFLVGFRFAHFDSEHVYLGMAVHRREGGGIFLTQRSYVSDVVRKLGFEGCRKTWKPSNGEKIYVADCETCHPKENSRGKEYRQLCGTLRWIEQCTRPDISATLAELCKVQANPPPLEVVWERGAGSNGWAWSSGKLVPPVQFPLLSLAHF